MPQFTIDGKVYEYEGSPMLLQFALDHGVEIPYFCYHPAMSVPTNCRMCLVEVGYMRRNRETGELERNENGEPAIMWGRKPNTACNTPVAPDMVVKTHRTSAAVKDMQKGVLEYMLVNHPLDCPICDQAGECPLQIWTYKYGPEGSRFESVKVHKPKRVELGPNVVLDAERCINCTRCVRFTEEISGTHQLSIIGRGEKNYPMTAPGEVFDDLYSMNTIDICPVGALTSKDFRFQARVWEMAYTPGICTGCANGCNVDVWVRDNQVMRLTPRENAAVNQYWMCDAGRAINHLNENRVSGTRIKGDIPVSFEDAYKRAATVLKAGGHVYFIGSAQASLEDNWTLRWLANKMGTTKVYYVPGVQKGWGDNFLRKDDRTPNAAACELLGFEAISADELAEKVNSHTCVTLDDSLLYLDGTRAVVLATQHRETLHAAEVIFPLATAIEAESTFINAKNMAQVSRMAKEIKQMTPEMWMRLPKSRLDKAAVAVDKWRHLEHVYDVLPGWLMLSRLAKELGHDLSVKEHKDIFAKLRSEFEILRDVKVSYKVPKEAFKSTQFDFAVK